MTERLNPSKAFPEEVVELEATGVPYPNWFAGPVYRGDGSVEAAVQRLETERETAGNHGIPSGEDDLFSF